MLPNLIIIGAMKCGTTSLHHYLSLHPEIKMSALKELDFFIESHNLHRGLDWYKSHFKGKAKIYGESSPNYTSYPRYPSVPSRMHALVPQAKLIYLVRDPIDRIISQYIHRCCKGVEDRSLSEALSDPSSNVLYLQRSLYYQQIEQYLAYYSSNQILVIAAEDLRDAKGTSRCECASHGSFRERTKSTLSRIFEFLAVDSNFYSQQYDTQLHNSEMKRQKTDLGKWLEKTPPARLLQKLPANLRIRAETLLYRPFSFAIERPHLNEAEREKLTRILAEDVKNLRSFTGCDFKNWQI